MNPPDILKGAAEHHFNHQLGLLKDPQPEPEEFPRFCFLVSKAEEKKLRRLLLSRNWARLLPESKLARRKGGRRILNGVFLVEGRPGKYRLIVDSRPGNFCFHSLAPVLLRLPIGTMFTLLILRPHEHIRGSGTDLDAFLHRLGQHEDVFSYYAFGRRIDASEARELGAILDEPHRLVVAVMAMGGLNSPPFAQVMHIGVLERAGLDVSDFLTYAKHAPVPRQRFLKGIVYDDLVVALKVPRSQLDAETGEDRDYIETAISAYARSDLPHSPSKGFGFGAERSEGSRPRGAGRSIAWGTQVNSHTGLVGAEDAKRALLFATILDLIVLPKVTVGLLRRVAACITHPLMHRRELLAYLHRFHKFCNGLSERQAVRPPADIIDELVCVALHLSVACTCIRWPISQVVFCTDATPDKVSSVVSRVHPDLAEALYYVTVSRGFHVPLDPGPAKLDEIDACLPCDPLSGEVVGSVSWSVSHAVVHGRSSQLNIRELEECCSSSDQISDLTLSPSRLVNGTDSVVFLGAIAKGRSSSLRLNSVLRKSASRKPLGRKYQCNFKVWSADNPADDPTRDVTLRSPVTPEPWLRGLLDGVAPEPSLNPCYRRILGGACREVFAGTSRLSWALKQAGL